MTRAAKPIEILTDDDDRQGDAAGRRTRPRRERDHRRKARRSHWCRGSLLIVRIDAPELLGERLRRWAPPPEGLNACLKKSLRLPLESKPCLGLPEEAVWNLEGLHKPGNTLFTGERQETPELRVDRLKEASRKKDRGRQIIDQAFLTLFRFQSRRQRICLRGSFIGRPFREVAGATSLREGLPMDDHGEE
jgi:hypothetical protein